VDDALVGAGSLQPMWLRICCARRNSHIIQQRFFFLAKFSQLEGIFFLENFQKIRHISEKKKKKKRKNSPDLDSESL
jgi:hypothetical protein